MKTASDLYMTMVINIFVKTCFKHLETKSSEEQFSLVEVGGRVGDGKAIAEGNPQVPPKEVFDYISPGFYLDSP